VFGERKKERERERERERESELECRRDVIEEEVLGDSTDI
jgi:hypothetical protein